MTASYPAGKPCNQSRNIWLTPHNNKNISWVIVILQKETQWILVMTSLLLRFYFTGGLDMIILIFCRQLTNNVATRSDWLARYPTAKLTVKTLKQHSQTYFCNQHLYNVSVTKCKKIHTLKFATLLVTCLLIQPQVIFQPCVFGDSKTVNSLKRDISWIQQKHVLIKIKNSTNAFHLAKCLVISLLPNAVATFKFHLHEIHSWQSISNMLCSTVEAVTQEWISSYSFVICSVC